MSNGVSYFETEETFGNYNAVEWMTPGLTVVIDQLGIMTQLVPASALPYLNESVIAGHDIGFQLDALQAGGTLPFNLTGVPINFYAKVNPSDSTNLFSKSLAGNPMDVQVPQPNLGVIQVFVRAADYTSVAVGTTIFLYVDGINSAGNPVNIGKWTLTITY
jgi:hypothetical protein